MLGVLKRRWKPSKRASSGRGTESPLSSDLALDKPRPVPSPRQIHPLYGEKAGLLGYYDAVGNTENFPPAPNIVVEGGRIEFVRPSQDVTTANTNTNTTNSRKNNTISRSSQTFVEQTEKSDPAKESLEERVQELEKILLNERAATQRDRATITKLQRQVNKREATQRDVERERRLRMEAEGRVREATADAERARARVHHLQRELARMEESSRGLLQHKQRADQLKQERAALTLSYESRVHQCQSQISKLQLENESMRGQLRGLEAACAGEVHAALVDRLATLETEHVALARDADAQRRQYERCLDDVANQVVRALLSQKGLREEIGGLQRRIRELESQNRALSGLLAQAANPGSPTELIQGIIEAGPGALVAALGLDPSWLPLSRPRSLNLKIPVMATTKSRRNRPLGQKPSEEEGSESPESVNRDEGYSTMSSDVQCEGARQEPSSRGLEDLKEATDETEADVSPDPRLVALDNADPDVLFLPLNLTVGINPRHSYPPNKDLLPYQHVMRSFSDSHLYLKLTTTATNLATSPYNIASPGAGSSSVLLVEEEGWDAEYVQQWLRLDDSRSAQQNRDLLELEYDRAELEDWSFSLSSDDLRSENCPANNGWKDSSLSTTNSGNAGTTQAAYLPPIKEQSNPIELEEDANECLWNGASYLADRAGGELVALLMDARATGPWPYASSPGASWSSEEGIIENSSKRSSAALSGCSDDPDSPSVGTDFTRDFYRLVKFESTKSLASTSSRGGKKQPQDREQALQSVLSFIAEQQMYIAELPQNSIEQNTVEVSDNVGDSNNDMIQTTTTTTNGGSNDIDESSNDRKNDIASSSNDHQEHSTIFGTLINAEDRLINPINCNASSIGLNYGSGAGIASELVAVPEEDEEAATSSTPSTVVSPARAPALLIEGIDRSLSFHEHATSKDVINELNRMIRKGEDNPSCHNSQQVVLDKLDLACCCPTGWVHVERDIDFTDPKARANLLDVMLASSESSSATSSSGSAGSDSGDEPPDYRHLHRLHRYRRQKKATAAHGHRVLRIPSVWGSSRPSIIGRGDDFFVRYGDKEREAVASFDFLDDINETSGFHPSSSSNLPSSESSIDDLLVESSMEFMKISPL